MPSTVMLGINFRRGEEEEGKEEEEEESMYNYD